eukprot:1139092-Pelagomonas_calceolata.AAC.1
MVSEQPQQQWKAWRGYSEDNSKWEPGWNLPICDEMLQQYKAKDGLLWRARYLKQKSKSRCVCGS